MTRQNRARIEELQEMKILDDMICNLSYSPYGTFFRERNLKPTAPLKDFYVCQNCIHGYARTCNLYQSCQRCPQYLKASKETDTTKTNCKCNTISYKERCPYYEPYRFGYKATMLFCDDKILKEKEQ